MSKLDADNEVMFVAVYIMRHLEKCPNAADTMDGILKSWLACHSFSLEEVRRAVMYLVEKGVLDELEITGRHIYCVAGKNRQYH